MTRILYIGCLLLSLFAVGCGSDEEDCLGERPTLEEYFEEQQLNPVVDERGFFYIIDEPGSAPLPSATATVTVNYKGTRTDMTTFDETPGTPRTFDLPNLIRGWQLGIPLIGTGGKIRLFLPSGLAYGQGPPPGLCPGESLIFDIELVEFAD